MVDYSTQNVSQLKELLKAKGLPSEGKKAELISRLQLADVSESSAAESSAKSVAEEPATKTETTATTEPKESDDLVAVEGSDDFSSKKSGEPTTEESKEESKDESNEDPKGETKVEGTHASKPESEATPAKEEPPKVHTPEERKQKALELLETKIRRAIKFGDEAGAAEAKRVLARVEKFGVELGTALAVELGIEKAKPENDKAAKRLFGRRNNGYKNKRAKRN